MFSLDQRERKNGFYGWRVHDKFNRPMGTLGEYIDNQEPYVVGNEQYEDSFGKFTLNEPPSGDELYATIKCYLWGIVKEYFRVCIYFCFFL